MECRTCGWYGPVCELSLGVNLEPASEIHGPYALSCDRRVDLEHCGDITPENCTVRAFWNFLRLSLERHKK